MTFYEWMLTHYHNPNTDPGELTVYLGKDEKRKTISQLSELLELLDDFSWPQTEWFHDSDRRMFEQCWNLYLADEHWMDDFLRDCCDVSEGFIEKSGAVQDRYREYCHKNGRWARSNALFYQTLTDKGFVRKKKRAGCFINGLRLKDRDDKTTPYQAEGTAN